MIQILFTTTLRALLTTHNCAKWNCIKNLGTVLLPWDCTENGVFLYRKSQPAWKAKLRSSRRLWKWRWEHDKPNSGYGHCRNHCPTNCPAQQFSSHNNGTKAFWVSKNGEVSELWSNSHSEARVGGNHDHGQMPLLFPASFMKDREWVVGGDKLSVLEQDYFCSQQTGL